MASVFIVDDNPMVCDLISKFVGRMGHQTRMARTLTEALAQARTNAFDVIFLDVNMPDGNGLQMLPQFRATPAHPEIIIITGDGDPDGAELAINSGAWDYIEKTASTKHFRLSLTRALQYREQKQAKKPLTALKRENIRGNSPQINACLDIVAQAAASDANVLICGETGTGKELFARAVHTNSARARKNFVVVDCAALPDNLLENMLFGHEKGAYTGADQTAEGLIQQANGGTLFLDEIGELSLTLQKVFLRVLQERRFRPIGGKREQQSHFRLVAATNRDLEQMVANAEFRKDLLFRINSIEIHLPPLRQRLEDIREIAPYYINNACRLTGEASKGFAPDFYQVLVNYPWPGNVRELINALDSALADSTHEPVLFPRHLPTNIRAQAARSQVGRKPLVENATRPDVVAVGQMQNMQSYLKQMQSRYLTELTAMVNGNVKKACQVSGLSRSHLYHLLKKHNLTLSAD